MRHHSFFRRQPGLQRHFRCMQAVPRDPVMVAVGRRPQTLQASLAASEQPDRFFDAVSRSPRHHPLRQSPCGLRPSCRCGSPRDRPFVVVVQHAPVADGFRFHRPGPQRALLQRGRRRHHHVRLVAVLPYSPCPGAVRGHRHEVHVGMFTVVAPRQRPEQDDRVRIKQLPERPRPTFDRGAPQGSVGADPSCLHHPSVPYARCLHSGTRSVILARVQSFRTPPRGTGLHDRYGGRRPLPGVPSPRLRGSGSRSWAPAPGACARPAARTFDVPSVRRAGPTSAALARRGPPTAPPAAQPTLPESAPLHGADA